MVLLINFSTENFVINDGERIAQMVLAKHEQCDFIEVNELDETERSRWIWSYGCKITNCLR